MPCWFRKSLQTALSEVGLTAQDKENRKEILVKGMPDDKSGVRKPFQLHTHGNMAYVST